MKRKRISRGERKRIKALHMEKAGSESAKRVMLQKAKQASPEFKTIRRAKRGIKIGKTDEGRSTFIDSVLEKIRERSEPAQLGVA